MPPRMLVSARIVDDETLPSPPISPTTAYFRERERARAQFVEEVQFEVWSHDPGSPPHVKPRTALGTLIQHGLLSEAVEMGTLEEFSRAAQEFLSSASRRVMTVEAFTDFSMAELS
jgi:hypothetical protein